jgi:hypothetical protein
MINVQVLDETDQALCKVLIHEAMKQPITYAANQTDDEANAMLSSVTVQDLAGMFQADRIVLLHLIREVLSE